MSRTLPTPTTSTLTLTEFSACRWLPFVAEDAALSVWKSGDKVISRALYEQLDLAREIERYEAQAADSLARLHDAEGDEADQLADLFIASVLGKMMIAAADTDPWAAQAEPTAFDRQSWMRESSAPGFAEAAASDSGDESSGESAASSVLVTPAASPVLAQEEFAAPKYVPSSFARPALRPVGQRSVSPPSSFRLPDLRSAAASPFSPRPNRKFVYQPSESLPPAPRSTFLRRPSAPRPSFASSFSSAPVPSPARVSNHAPRCVFVPVPVPASARSPPSPPLPPRRRPSGGRPLPPSAFRAFTQPSLPSSFSRPPP